MAATVGNKGDARAEAMAGGAMGDTFDDTAGITTGADVGRGAVAVGGGTGVTTEVGVGAGMLALQATRNELRIMRLLCSIFI